MLAWPWGTVGVTGAEQGSGDGGKAGLGLGQKPPGAGGLCSGLWGAGRPQADRGRLQSLICSEGCWAAARGWRRCQPSRGRHCTACVSSVRVWARAGSAAAPRPPTAQWLRRWDAISMGHGDPAATAAVPPGQTSEQPSLDGEPSPKELLTLPIRVTNKRKVAWWQSPMGGLGDGMVRAGSGQLWSFSPRN